MATMSLEMIEEIRDVARAYAEGERLRYERLRAAQAQPAVPASRAPRTARRSVAHAE
jgi:hypothetical protein